MLDTKFHASNSKNNDLQYNGTFILPDYIILIFQIVKLGKKWLAYFYRLAKTTLDTKFHVSNSKNKKKCLMVPSFYLIYPLRPPDAVVLAQIWTRHSNGLEKRSVCWKFQKNRSKIEKTLANVPMSLFAHIPFKKISLHRFSFSHGWLTIRPTSSTFLHSSI